MRRSSDGGTGDAFPSRLPSRQTPCAARLSAIRDGGTPLFLKRNKKKVVVNIYRWRPEQCFLKISFGKSAVPPSHGPKKRRNLCGKSNSTGRRRSPTATTAVPWVGPQGYDQTDIALRLSVAHALAGAIRRAPQIGPLAPTTSGLGEQVDSRMRSGGASVIFIHRNTQNESGNDDMDENSGFCCSPAATPEHAPPHSMFDAPGSYGRLGQTRRAPNVFLLI